jgi:hypothetical protein
MKNMNFGSLMSLMFLLSNKEQTRWESLKTR